MAKASNEGNFFSLDHKDKPKRINPDVFFSNYDKKTKTKTERFMVFITCLYNQMQCSFANVTFFKNQICRCFEQNVYRHTKVRGGSPAGLGIIRSCLSRQLIRQKELTPNHFFYTQHEICFMRQQPHPVYCVSKTCLNTKTSFIKGVA